MSIIDNVIERVKKQDKKTIVLSETEDRRILEATDMILKKDFCNIILIGNKEEIINKNQDLNLEGAIFIDNANYEKIDELTNTLYELRKHKGMTIEQAGEIIKDSTYFATMLVKVGLADGLVCGATHSTADTLRPGLQIVKTVPNALTVSSFSIMETLNCKYSDDNIFFFADTGLIPNPTEEELAEIAIQTAKSYKAIMNKEPIVAMLSYSTYGSAKGDMPQKIINATNIAKEKMPELLIDGEMQLDAAVVESVGKSKAPDSKVAGKANVLVFPDLNSGNIGYKLVERLGNASAYGPITQGMAKPINDLSRGCKAEDIVGVVAITCLQV